MTTPFLQSILPGVFGFVGTILGAVVARGGTMAQRRQEADAQARARMAAFTQAATELMRRGRGHNDELWVEYLRAKDDVRIALLAAGISLDTVNAVLWISVADGFHYEAWLRPHVERASAVFELFELPHWRRRPSARRLAERFARPLEPDDSPVFDE